MRGLKSYKRFAGLGVAIVLVAGLGVAIVLVAGRSQFPSSSRPTVRAGDQSKAKPIAADLVTAIRNADAPVIRKLLDDGADVNGRDAEGNTPLILASLCASPDCVDLLIGKGTDVNAANKAGATALIRAATSHEKVSLLVAAGANVRATTWASAPSLRAPAAPYVNVVALMIGGRGRDEVRAFYSNHFLSQIPPDMETVPVSRTIGQGRVVDELIMRFTHSIRMNWLLPGIAPTGKRVAVPMVAIVQFEGDKVAHEHIYWDQASLLVQVGLLDPALPVRGGEIAAQVLSPTQPMNELIRRAMNNNR